MSVRRIAKEILFPLLFYPSSPVFSVIPDGGLCFAMQFPGL